MESSAVSRPGIALTFALAVALTSSCSDGSIGPRKGLAPLVGVWRADALVMTERANPSEVVDLVQEGMVLTLSILGNGGYSAVIQGLGAYETGTISVSGNRITLTPTAPSSYPATEATWTLEGDVLILDGETEFDFGGDGTREAADVHMELHRVQE